MPRQPNALAGWTPADPAAMLSADINADKPAKDKMES
jgi:hypothetical protein